MKGEGRKLGCPARRREDGNERRGSAAASSAAAQREQCGMKASNTANREREGEREKGAHYILRSAERVPESEREGESAGGAEGDGGARRRLSGRHGRVDGRWRGRTDRQEADAAAAAAAAAAATAAPPVAYLQLFEPLFRRGWSQQPPPPSNSVDARPRAEKRATNRRHFNISQSWCASDSVAAPSVGGARGDPVPPVCAQERGARILGMHTHFQVEG